MAIHHQVEIKNVLCQSQKQLSMKNLNHYLVFVTCDGYKTDMRISAHDKDEAREIALKKKYVINVDSILTK